MATRSLSKPALLSLTALCLHFSLLSIVLHLSRTLPGRRYHASSAIFLTELGKIIVSWFLVLWTGELKPSVKERLRLRELERQRDEEEEEIEMEMERQRRVREEEESWIKEMVENGGGVREREKPSTSSASEGSRRSGDADGWTDATVVPMHRRTSSLAGSDTSSSSLKVSVPKPRGPSTLSINVPLANNRSAPPPSASHVPGAPSLAIIPATPIPDPSPTRFPDQSALYPERISGRFDEPEPTMLEDACTLEWWRCLWSTVWGDGVWRLAILAFLFMLQGQAQYIASGNLSVPVFQLAYQLKIPATALSSVILLNKALTRQQWASLFVLTFGVGLVQVFSVTSQAAVDAAAAAATAALDSDSTPLPSASAFDGLSTHSEAPPNQFLGLTAVIAACISSGFASVYFERILKVPSSPSNPSSTSSSAANSPDLSLSASSTSSPILSPGLPSMHSQPTTSITDPRKVSLWIRNIQLSIFGLVVGLPIVLWEMRGCLGALDYGYLDVSVEMGEAVSGEAVAWWERVGKVAVAAGGNFFDGFNAVTWVVIALQITGGLLSALVMKHADNLLKCFATSLSILISIAVSVVLFNFHITLGIFLGAVLVLGSTFAYTSPSKDWRWRPSAMGSPSGGSYVSLPQGLGTR